MKTLILITLLFLACTNDTAIKPDGNYSGMFYLNSCDDCIKTLTIETSLQSEENNLSGTGHYSDADYEMQITGYVINDSVYFEFRDCIGGLTLVKGKFTKSTITGVFEYYFAENKIDGTFKLNKL
jgi:hypothetical protein